MIVAIAAAKIQVMYSGTSLVGAYEIMLKVAFVSIKLPTASAKISSSIKSRTVILKVCFQREKYEEKRFLR